MSGNVHYYRRFMMENNRYALKLELCCLSHILAESFHLKYKDIVSILGTKYGRMDWSCGSVRLACIFTSVTLLHVVFVYCLRKRLFLICPAPQALSPCCGESWSPQLLWLPCDSSSLAGHWRWVQGPRALPSARLPQVCAC